MEYRTLIGARVPIARVPERSKLFLVRLESLPNNFSGLFKNDNHECPHKECCICLLVKLGRSVVEKFDCFVALISEQSAELSNVFVSVCDV